MKHLSYSKKERANHLDTRIPLIITGRESLTEDLPVATTQFSIKHKKTTGYLYGT